MDKIREGVRGKSGSERRVPAGDIRTCEGPAACTKKVQCV